MRKNLTRIASLVLACVLFSVPAFAALTGGYSNGTFTVSGGETGLQTSLIIVKGNHTTLPVANEAVTGAIYIDQVPAASNVAAFTGISLDANEEVHTAFFSNESENSASSFKIVTAELTIAADNYTVEAGQKVIISANRTGVSFVVNDVATDLTEEGGGYAFIPATAGTYTIVASATVAGQTITSDPIVITATEVVNRAILTVNAAEVLEDVYTVDSENNVKDGEIVTPVYVNVTLPAGALNKMKWVLTVDEDLVCSETYEMNGVAVSGSATFAAIIKNGLRVDGTDTGNTDVAGVGAIFNIGDADYFTSEAIQNKFIAE